MDVYRNILTGSSFLYKCLIYFLPAWYFLYCVASVVDGSVLPDSAYMSHHPSRSSHNHNAGARTTSESLGYVAASLPEPTEPGRCVRCSPQETSRNRRLEGVKADILLKLGLHAPPPKPPADALPRRNASNIRPLETLLDSDRMMSDFAVRSEDDYAFRAEKIISFGSSIPADVNPRPPASSTFFALSSRVRINLLDKTHLYVFIKPPTNKEGETRNLSMSLRMIQAPDDENDPGGERFDPELWSGPHIVSVGHKGSWEKFSGKNVHKLIHRWLADPSTNQGVVIKAVDENGTDYAITQITPQDSEYGPYLEIRLDDNVYRHRRSLPFDCSESHPANHCCRYPLHVDFQSFGWDFIIAPRTYDAYYCSGECKANFNPSNNHAHMRQSIVSQASAALAINNPGPCCTPSKVNDLMMLYYDDKGDIVYGTIPGMIVSRCACA